MTDVSFSQYINDSVPILVKPLGRFIVSSLRHSRNAASSMFVKPSGKLTDAKLLHSWNAHALILVMPALTVTAVSSEHSLNPSSPTAVTLNESSSASVTVAGSVREPAISVSPLPTLTLRFAESRISTKKSLI